MVDMFFCSEKGRVELSDPDNIDAAADMWIAVMKKSAADEESG
jgi:hypothetical protein